MALLAKMSNKGVISARRASEMLFPSEGMRSSQSKATAASAEVSRKNSGQKSSNPDFLFFMRV